MPGVGQVVANGVGTTTTVETAVGAGGGVGVDEGGATPITNPSQYVP